MRAEEPPYCAISAVGRFFSVLWPVDGERFSFKIKFICVFSQSVAKEVSVLAFVGMRMEHDVSVLKFGATYFEIWSKWNFRKFLRESGWK